MRLTKYSDLYPIPELVGIFITPRVFTPFSRCSTRLPRPTELAPCACMSPIPFWLKGKHLKSPMLSIYFKSPRLCFSSPSSFPCAWAVNRMMYPHATTHLYMPPEILIVIFFFFLSFPMSSKSMVPEMLFETLAIMELYIPARLYAPWYGNDTV